MTAIKTAKAGTPSLYAAAGSFSTMDTVTLAGTVVVFVVGGNVVVVVVGGSVVVVVVGASVVVVGDALACEEYRSPYGSSSSDKSIPGPSDGDG